MDLVIGTLVLRPYVFAFLVLFLTAGTLDLGWRRTLLFGACVWPLAWLAEFTSTRVGVPFGLYHYTEETRGREIFIANVPFMDCLSFVFLAYAAFCLARLTLAPWFEPGQGEVPCAHHAAVVVLAAVLMMALDVVIDPLAVRGDRWFLGRIFYYPDGGVYFGVPLSNFAGWLAVGVAGIGGYVALARGSAGREPRGGVALYYAVLAFNLAVTAWIGEWWLTVVGLALHGAVTLGLRILNLSVGARVALDARGVQGA
jgi:putative membrane protein